MTKEEFLSLKEGDKIICYKDLIYTLNGQFIFKRNKIYTVKFIYLGGRAYNDEDLIFVKETSYGEGYECFNIVSNSIRFIKSLS